MEKQDPALFELSSEQADKLSPLMTQACKAFDKGKPGFILLNPREDNDKWIVYGTFIENEYADAIRAIMQIRVNHEDDR
jgi:hypothetical protein